MINSYSISATEDTPEISFNKSQGIFSISGRALPEDASEFFAPAKKWLNSYVEKPNAETVFEIKLEYFNSSSAKQLVDMLITLEDLKGKSDAKILWYYTKDDEIIQTRGEEIKSIVEVPFEIKAFESS